jgi:hypothetical protein
VNTSRVTFSLITFCTPFRFCTDPSWRLAVPHREPLQLALFRSYGVANREAKRHGPCKRSPRPSGVRNSTRMTAYRASGCVSRRVAPRASSEPRERVLNDNELRNIIQTERAAACPRTTSAALFRDRCGLSGLQQMPGHADIWHHSGGRRTPNNSRSRSHRRGFICSSATLLSALMAKTLNS